MLRMIACILVSLVTSSHVFAKAPDFSGRFAADSVAVELRPTAGGYEGSLRDDDEVMPLRGQVQNGRLVDTLFYEGQKIAFRATLMNDKLSFTVEDTTVVLARQTAPKSRAAAVQQESISSAAGSPPVAFNEGFTRFRRVSVEDRQVIGGEAVSFLVPADWKIEGGIVWRPHPVLPAGAQIKVFDLHGHQQVEVFPSFPYTWGDNCGPGKLMPTGARWFGNEVHPPFSSTRECLASSIIPRIRGTINWHVIQGEDLPQLAAAHQKNTPAEAGAQTIFDAARVRIAYSLNDISLEEDIFAVLQTTRVSAGNIVIQIADRVVAMRAERGQLDAARPVHLAIVNSSRINVQWFNRYVQLVDFFIRAKMQEIRAIGEFSRALSRTSSQISDQRMRQWQDTNRRQDRIDREWSEYMRGTETYSDPVRGEPVELPSTNKHAWVNRGGEYILTDNPNFNPNVELRGEWVEMQPAP